MDWKHTRFNGLSVGESFEYRKEVWTKTSLTTACRFEDEPERFENLLAPVKWLDVELRKGNK